MLFADPKPKQRNRSARKNERNSPLQQAVYPEERRSYASYLAGLGLRGKDLRRAVTLASLLSIIVTAYVNRP